MAEASRERWMEVLGIVAQRRPDEAEAEWAWLMKELELGPEYFLALHEVIRQGQWREAENPGGYIKAAAKREARRLSESGERRPRGLRGFQGIIISASPHRGSSVPRLETDGLETEGAEITVGGAEIGGERLSQEDVLDHLEYRQDSGKPTPDPDGVWRSAPGWGADDEGLLRPSGIRRRRGGSGGESFKEAAERVLRLRAAEGRDTSSDPYIDEAQQLEVSATGWQRWAENAGLNEWEKKAVEYKISGVGWREAVAEQPDEVSRRALRAAWRRLERTGQERMKEAAKKSFPQDVAKQGGNDTE
jgi:hypothetical protein